jgi:hypothetical protein
MRKFVLAGVLVAALAFVGISVAVYEHNRTDTGPAYGRTSGESQRLNDAYLNYVRMNNPELRSEPDGNLLVVGYKICGSLHTYSEITLRNMAEVAYPGAGKRIYDGATQYLCEEGS